MLGVSAIILASCTAFLLWNFIPKSGVSVEETTKSDPVISTTAKEARSEKEGRATEFKSNALLETDQTKADKNDDPKPDGSRMSSPSSLDALLFDSEFLKKAVFPEPGSVPPPEYRRSFNVFFERVCVPIRSILEKEPESCLELVEYLSQTKIPPEVRRTYAFCLRECVQSDALWVQRSVSSEENNDRFRSVRARIWTSLLDGIESVQDDETKTLLFECFPDPRLVKETALEDLVPNQDIYARLLSAVNASRSRGATVFYLGLLSINIDRDPKVLTAFKHAIEYESSSERKAEMLSMLVGRTNDENALRFALARTQTLDFPGQIRILNVVDGVKLIENDDVGGDFKAELETYLWRIFNGQGEGPDWRRLRGTATRILISECRAEKLEVFLDTLEKPLQDPVVVSNILEGSVRRWREGVVFLRISGLSVDSPDADLRKQGFRALRRIYFDAKSKAARSEISDFDLQDIHGKICDVVVLGLRDIDETVRADCVKYLGEFGRRTDLQVLRDLVHTSPSKARLDTLNAAIKNLEMRYKK